MICTLAIESESKAQVIDLTDRVQAAIAESGARKSLCVVSASHTTASVFVNENDPSLQGDLLALLERLAPEGAQYAHADTNAHAHLRSMILGRSACIPIKDGRLELGTWGRILLGEWDGPRRRTVTVACV